MLVVGVGSKLSDVSIYLRLRPMLFNDGLAEGIDLAKDVFDTWPNPVGSEGEASDAAE